MRTPKKQLTEGKSQNPLRSSFLWWTTDELMSAGFLLIVIITSMVNRYM
jgi:hypothetical protein